MAKKYSRSRGKAGSKKPAKKSVPVWLKLKPKELELLIVKLSKEGKSPSMIGMTLRDAYGVPDTKLVLKKSITEILLEKKLMSDVPEDLLAFIRKVVSLKKHIDENPNDQTSIRGLHLHESRIKRLVKYYKRTGKLASEWKYDPEKAGLFTE